MIQKEDPIQIKFIADKTTYVRQINKPKEAHDVICDLFREFEDYHELRFFKNGEWVCGVEYDILTKTKIMIPKEFFLFGQKITVEFNNNRLDDLEALGACKNSTNEIIISDNYRGDKLPDNSIEQTFYHELVHQILFKMNENDLSENEKFVQVFSGLLHQYEKTKK